MGRSKFISLLLCLVLGVSLLIPTALATEGPDLTKSASLTMTFQPDGIPAQGGDLPGVPGGEAGQFR